MAKKTIYLTVTNDLNYDQRMQRICTSLSQAGYRVVLVGRVMQNSTSITQQAFEQKRLRLIFAKGKLFYIEYNIRLFLFLFFKKMDAICSIDLDTIMPCLYISKIKKIPRVYDAHELFTEMKEVVTRPKIHRFWLWVERKSVPQFKNGYTVNNFIANELKNRYAVEYGVIRNLPRKQSAIGRGQTIESEQQNSNWELPSENFFLYQGAVNEGRGFETLVPAIKTVDAKLVVVGDGNFMPQLKKIISENGLQEKVILLGNVKPGHLNKLTPKAYAGITIFEATGLNQFQSLANRFFDYFNAGIPQLCVNFPEYKAINKQYEIAYLIADTKTETISEGLNKLLFDKNLYNTLKTNTSKASKELCWEIEEKKLILNWDKILNK